MKNDDKKLNKSDESIIDYGMIIPILFESKIEFIELLLKKER